MRVNASTVGINANTARINALTVEDNADTVRIDAHTVNKNGFTARIYGCTVNKNACTERFNVRTADKNACTARFDDFKLKKLFENYFLPTKHTNHTKKRRIYFTSSLIFRAFRVFRGQKLIFQTASKRLATVSIPAEQQSFAFDIPRPEAKAEMLRESIKATIKIIS